MYLWEKLIQQNYIMGNLQVKFFQVGCGDAISIRFKGNDEKFHNILVDGGEKQKFKNGLRTEIETIVTNNENIDLWIITHIDGDHIGSILAFIEDNHKRLLKKVDFSKTTFWYNSANKMDKEVVLSENNSISVPQGIRLRDYLAKNSILCEKILNTDSAKDFFGAKITVLSPNQEKYSAMLEYWEEEEKKREVSAKTSDYKTKLDSFDLSKFEEDKAIPNGSSIAFLFEYQEFKILFLADSHPTVIIESLKKLGFNTTNNKLKLDYMQVAHHGSKGNTNDELLQLIDCQNFIISADGINADNLPNKETLVRIIKNKNTQPIRFLITEQNNTTDSIFDVDSKLADVICEFPKNNQYITITK